MSRVFLSLAILAVTAGTSIAGPFGRRVVATSKSSSCVGGQCNASSVRVVTRGGAQAHAEAMAASGSLVHASSHPGFEGVGYGATAESALRNCCNNGGEIIDQGVAQSRDGRWFACIRRR